MKNNRSTLILLLTVLLGVAACVLLLWITAPYGVGVNSDSLSYIGAAKSLLAGRGLTVRGTQMTHFPPVYPMVLAGVSLLTRDSVEAARLLNALLFGINAMLVAFAAYLATARKPLAAIGAAAFFLVSAPILDIHAEAWSEPLFIGLVLTCLLFLSVHVARPRWLMLVSSAVALGLATVTRYVGVALIPMAAVFLLVFREGAMRYRIRDALVTLAVACAPLVVWLFGAAHTGPLADRGFAVHPASLSQVRQLVGAIYSYTLPVPGPDRLKLAVVGLGVACGIVLLVAFGKSRKERLNAMDPRAPAALLPVLCVLFSSAYVLFLFLSISFVDASTPADARILSPVFILLLLAVISLVWSGSGALRSWKVRLGFGLLLPMLFASNALRAVSLAVEIRREGNDASYAGLSGRDSECLAVLKSLPDSVRVYTNGFATLRLLTHRETVFMVPRKTDPYTLQPNRSFKEEVEAMRRDCRDNRAVLVYLTAVHRPHLLTQVEAESFCSLPVLRRLTDATVYGGESVFGQ